MNLTVLVGQTATFTCVATAEPAHIVVWQFEGATLTNSDKYNITDVSSTTSVLEIRNVTAMDDGRYMCLVENEHGEDMDEAVLTVICELLVWGHSSVCVYMYILCVFYM